MRPFCLSTRVNTPTVITTQKERLALLVPLMAAILRNHLSIDPWTIANRAEELLCAAERLIADKYTTAPESPQLTPR